jgi:hypothetical protein
LIGPVNVCSLICRNEYKTNRLPDCSKSIALACANALQGLCVPRRKNGGTAGGWNILPAFTLAVIISIAPVAAVILLGQRLGLHRVIY